MNIRKNARLTPIGRERLVMAVLSGQTPEAAARAAGGCPRTARKWMKRFEAEGRAGLQDRSSRPAKLRRPTPDETVRQVIALRRRRFTGKQIAAETGVSPATVSRILKRAGLSRLKDLEPEEPVRRYERSRPGEMLLSTRRWSFGETSCSWRSISYPAGLTKTIRCFAGCWI